MGVLLIRTKSLGACIVAHGVTNFTLYLYVDLFWRLAVYVIEGSSSIERKDPMIRVIHLGLGDIGKATIEGILAQPKRLKLVGVVDINPELVGKPLRR